MSVQSGKKSSRIKKGIIDEQIPQNLFPEVFDIQSLKVNPALPILKFIKFKDTQRTKKSSIDLEIKLTHQIQKADLFLYVNKSKRDMFYQIDKGIYSFKNIKLKSGENLLEFFYRIGSKKSLPVFSVVYKEGE